MEFKKINEKDYKNEKYIVRSYGINRGSYLTDYKSIKENCLYKKEYCLVEKKTEYYTLCWDLDFKDSLDEYYKMNHEKITKYIIEKINESINELIINVDKDYVYSESTIGLGKHIYYIFIRINKNVHIMLYDLILKKIKLEGIYKKEIIEKIIDKSVCDYNGIRLYGCIYNGGYYYPVKEKSTYNISGDIENDFDHCLINSIELKYNFELKIILDEEKKGKKELTNENNDLKEINENNDLKEINELLIIIQEKNQNYESWLNIGMALHTIENSERMRDLWYNWSSINYKSNENEINMKWKSFKNVKNPLTIGTIKKMARENNNNEYLEWYNKYNKRSIINLIKDFDQQTVAKYFKLKKPDNYIYKKGEWYVLMENNLWRLMYKNENSKLINDITETLKDDLIELKNNIKPEDEILKLIPSVSKRLGTSKFISGVIDYLREKYRDDSIEFDNKSNLFSFNNIVYDLEKNEWINFKKEDMVTITTGYNWKDPSIEDEITVKKIISEIHPDEEVRLFYLDIICSGLWGITLQNYIIFNGSGSNGKSMLNDLILKAMGNYGHIINSIILCEQRKQGANTEIANLNKKRIVIAREPPKKQNVKLSNSLLKELTGGSEISARKIYSDNEKTSLCLTLILECNKKPLLEEEPTEADMRRIIDLLFASKFTDDKEQLNEKNIYKKNSYYVEEEFREKYKYALLKILFNHNKNHYNKNLIIPEKVKKRTTDYMESSVEIFEWFNETFEKIENSNEDDYITISDINDILKSSEYYETLSKNDKRKLTREKIVKLFKENSLYKKNYSDELNTHKDGIKVNIPKRIRGYKIKAN